MNIDCKWAPLTVHFTIYDIRCIAAFLFVLIFWQAIIITHSGSKYLSFFPKDNHLLIKWIKKGLAPAFQIEMASVHIFQKDLLLL